MTRRSKPLARSTKPLKRTPVRKRRKGPPRRGSAVKNPEFREWVRHQPCLLCYTSLWSLLLKWSLDPKWVPMVTGVFKEDLDGARYCSECAHLGKSTSVRGTSQKYPDSEAGPLCHSCHEDHHKGTRTFWTRHPWLGENRDRLIDLLQRCFVAQGGKLKESV